MKLRPQSTVPGQADAEVRVAEPVAAGDYFHSERDLFWIAECVDGRALIEDCRTGVLIELEIDRVLGMDRVERGRSH